MSRILFSPLAALAATAAFGQNAAGELPHAGQIEATAFLGYRAGGSFDIQDADGDADVASSTSYALALDYQINSSTAYEFFIAHQPTRLDLAGGRNDLDVNYLMLGSSVVMAEGSPLNPYVVGLIGVGQFKLDAPGADDKSRFAISVALGLRVPLRERIALRLEARGYLTFVDTQSSVFCSSGSTGATCLLRGSGSTFFQGELLAGIAMSFR
jgi:Outer membrane protein beta-barrel domain